MDGNDCKTKENIHNNKGQLKIKSKFSFDSVSSVTMSRIEACLQDTTAWVFLNKLKLNSEKTELLVFDRKVHLLLIFFLSQRLMVLLFSPHRLLGTQA